MTEPIEAFSTLDDFLLSLAEGVAFAQNELSRAGAATAGSALTLPRVDFELKMNLTVVQNPVLSQRYSLWRPVRTDDRHLLFRPISSDESSSTLEIAATVKGAFVAVPPNGGLPAPILRSSVDATDPSRPVLHVTLRNTAGEPLPGVEVQFNIDREESVSLNQAAGRSFSVASDTTFEHSIMTTGAEGAAETALMVGQSQQPGLLVLVVDALSRTETTVYEVSQ